MSVHPRTGNVHRFPIQCRPHRGLPWSVSVGGQRMVGGCVGGSYRLQGFHMLFPSLSPQTQTTNPQTGAPEVTQPCLRWHSGHQKLFFKTPLFPLRTGRAGLRGAFSGDSTREGLPWQRLLGVPCGADGCVSTRVVLHCLLPDTRPSCFLGGPGVLSTPGGGGAQRPHKLQPCEGSDRPSPWSPERHSCPLTLHLHVRTQPLGTKDHRPPLRGCGIRVQGAFLS